MHRIDGTWLERVIMKKVSLVMTIPLWVYAIAVGSLAFALAVDLLVQAWLEAVERFAMLLILLILYAEKRDFSRGEAK